MNRKKNASTVLVYGVLIFITLICLFPIVWMCLISIKSTSESITGFNSQIGRASCRERVYVLV